MCGPAIPVLRSVFTRLKMRSPVLPHWGFFFFLYPTTTVFVQACAKTHDQMCQLQAGYWLLHWKLEKEKRGE